MAKGETCEMYELGKLPWWNPAGWDPIEHTDFLREAENLNNQWILLERRARVSLDADSLAALRKVIDAYVHFWETEAKPAGSGWFLGDDRKKLDEFKRAYDAWYKTAQAADPKLASHVVPPKLSIGPASGYKEDKGFWASLREFSGDVADKTEDIVRSQYFMPILATSALFLGFIWISSRTGKRKR